MICKVRIMQVNVTNLTDMTSFVDLIDVTNGYTYGWIGIFVLMGIFAVAYFSSKRYPTLQAFTQASFITTVSCVFLLIMGLVPFIAFGFCLIGTAVVAIALYYQR